MNIRVAYISYADYGGPLVHTNEFVNAFRQFVPDLVTHCPFLGKSISYGRPGPVSFFNKAFMRLPRWAPQLKIEFYFLRKLMREFFLWPQYSKLYNRNEIDVAVIRNDLYVLGAIVAARKNRIPYILEINGIISKDWPDRITRYYEKYILKNASGIYTVSEQMAKLLYAVGAKKSKIRVITNGVALERFAMPDMSNIPSDLAHKVADKTVIGYIGTFTPHHDLLSVVKGFKHAIEKKSDLALILVGEGRNDPVVKQCVNQLSLSKNVIFPGRIPFEKIPAYLNLFHIAANPMKQTYEEDFVGVPIKMFEYMAAKLPIISTDMPNLRKLLGTAALYVQPEKPLNWAEAILALATNEQLRKNKGREGYDRLIQFDYTWKNNASKVYDFCKQVHRSSNANK